MKNFWEKLDKPFFVMAPMAGITDQSFRLMCKKYGADVVYSEMISSEALWHNRLCHSERAMRVEESQRSFGKLKMTKNNEQLLKTLKLIQFSKIERPYVVQIFGSDPEKMALSAEYIASGKWFTDYQEISKSKYQMSNQIQNPNGKLFKKFDICNLSFDITSIPDGIDVNMGCPARDVIKTGAGVALMKNQDLAIKIIKAIKKRVKNIPISVKTRIGWENSDGLINFTKRLEKAGADAIAIHGRTYKQGFVGKVDWKKIKEVKKQIKIPVIGNGGIDENFKFEILNLILDLDGYMVGRGALGKPWIFEKLKNQNEKLKVNESPCDDYIDRKKLAKIILKHAELVDKYKGKQGIREFRKNFAWYLRGIPNSKKIREKAVRVENIEDINKICKYMV